MPAPRDNGNALKHGLGTLKRLSNNRKINRRSSIGRLHGHIQGRFEADLGGKENLSAQESALIGPMVFKVLILLTMEGWALQQPRLVKRAGKLPAVLDRNYISWAESLRRDLVAIGLERRSKDLNLNDFLSQERKKP